MFQLEQSLEANPLFKDFSPYAVKYLIANCEVLHLNAETLLREEDENPLSDFLVLLEGEWIMQRWVRGVKEPLIFQSSKPGTWHGGIALVDTVAPATVKTLSESYILKIPEQVMYEMIRRDYPITTHILKGAHWGIGKFLEMRTP
jgi:hypothetical protein